MRCIKSAVGWFGAPLGNTSSWNLAKILIFRAIWRNDTVWIMWKWSLDQILMTLVLDFAVTLGQKRAFIVTGMTWWSSFGRSAARAGEDFKRPFNVSRFSTSLYIPIFHASAKMKLPYESLVNVFFTGYVTFHLSWSFDAVFIRLPSRRSDAPWKSNLIYGNSPILVNHP